MDTISKKLLIEKDNGLLSIIISVLLIGLSQKPKLFPIVLKPAY